MIQSATFWLVLLATWCVHLAIPLRWRRGLLGLASISYISWLAPVSAAMLALWVVLVFALLRIPERYLHRAATALILAIIGVLAYFKYIPPLVQAFVGDTSTTGLLIPLGISFYSFKLIHFCVEVNRREITRTSLSDISLYFFWFPVFTAGPIERFDSFSEGDNAELSVGREDVLIGIRRIQSGLIKKFLICELILNRLYGSLSTENVFEYLPETSTPRLWFFLAVFYLSAYLDFSAYSDIAIGASRMFGLRIIENFNFPIIATNISDFWRRWHISLSKWCQTYVYLPVLGYSRLPFVAAYSSFTVFSLWHAGTFTRLTWGLIHASAIVAYSYWNRQKRSRRWTWTQARPWKAVSYVLTQGFIVATMFALIAEEAGVAYWDSYRLLAKLFFLNI